MGRRVAANQPPNLLSVPPPEIEIESFKSCVETSSKFGSVINTHLLAQRDDQLVHLGEQLIGI